MFESIRNFWKEWEVTAIGKAAKDFYYTVIYSSVAAGLTAVLPLFASGQTDLSIAWGVFWAGVTVAFFKSVSLFIDKYRNPEIPNSPLS